MPHFPTVSRIFLVFYNTEMGRLRWLRNKSSAYDHYKTIKEHKILHFDLGTWFGAHFDFDVGDYVIDKTGLPLESEGLNLTKSFHGNSRIKLNSLYGVTWWSVDDDYRKSINASVLCLKYEDGYCIKDGEINLFTVPCIESAKQ